MFIVLAFLTNIAQSQIQNGGFEMNPLQHDMEYLTPLKWQSSPIAEGQGGPVISKNTCGTWGSTPMPSCSTKMLSLQPYNNNQICYKSNWYN